MCYQPFSAVPVCISTFDDTVEKENCSGPVKRPKVDFHRTLTKQASIYKQGSLLSHGNYQQKLLLSLPLRGMINLSIKMGLQSNQ